MTKKQMPRVKDGQQLELDLEHSARRRDRDEQLRQSWRYIPLRVGGGIIPAKEPGEYPTYTE